MAKAKKPKKNLGGRPLKFKSPKALQAAIDAYFASCFEPIMVRQIKREAFDLQKHLPERVRRFTEDDYEWVAKKDWTGEPQLDQVRPFSITGLAMALNTSRQTLVNYEARDRYFDAIKAAKLKCENFVEEGMLKGRFHPVTGIFNLKNNYEWKDEATTKHDLSDNLADLIRGVDDKPDRKKTKTAV